MTKNITRIAKYSAFIGLALAVVNAQPSSAANKASNATLVPSGEIQWTAVPGMDGIWTAQVEGDANKGPHHSFTKFKAGFTAPEHHHSANHFVAVVAGTLVLTVDGKEHSLPAGSYFTFKNKAKHATKCAEGDDCVLFGDIRGKWDVVMPKQQAK